MGPREPLGNRPAGRPARTRVSRRPRGVRQPTGEVPGRRGLPGIAFLTYAENFSQRYEDEFGYAEPVVAEFQKRHGVDIRTQAFDRQAWRQLRGEHVTAFLRLLKQKLAPHAIRIAVCVDGQQPDQAMRWTVDGGVRTAGNWSWSVPEWLRGGVVDELCLFNPPMRPSAVGCWSSPGRRGGSRDLGVHDAGTA